MRAEGVKCSDGSSDSCVVVFADQNDPKVQGVLLDGLSDMCAIVSADQMSRKCQAFCWMVCLMRVWLSLQISTSRKCKVSGKKIGTVRVILWACKRVLCFFPGMQTRSAFNSWHANAFCVLHLACKRVLRSIPGMQTRARGYVNFLRCTCVLQHANARAFHLHGFAQCLKSFA